MPIPHPRVCLVLIVMLLPASAFALSHQWSRAVGDAQSQTGSGVVLHANGSLTMVGSMEGTVDFGAGPLTSAGGFDVFIVHYDASGNHLWSTRYGDAGADFANGVALDNNGNIIVVGKFWGAIDFGGGALTSVGGYDVFVAKLDPGGNHVWSTRHGGPASDDCVDVTSDPVDNVLVVGDFYSTIDFGGGTLTTAGQRDIYVAKLNPLGAHIWSQRFGDDNSDYCTTVASDNSGNVIFARSYADSIDFSGVPFVTTGSNNVYVAKFDPLGSHVWSQSFGDNQFQGLRGASVDAVGNVIITGYFSGTMDFGGGPLLGSSAADIFLAKFDPLGTHQWSKQFGDSFDYQWVDDVATDAAGDVFLTGDFYGTVDFGGGTLTSVGGRDLYVAQFDAFGSHVWSARYGDTNADAPNAIAAGSSSCAAVAGEFTGSIDFGGGAMTSGGDFDGFVVKFGDTPTGINTSDMSGALSLTAYPNPFNPTTHIQFSIDQEERVLLAIYDTAGRLVATLVDRRMGAGTYSEEWNGEDEQGSAVASGVYFYRLQAGNKTLARKAVLLK